MFFPCIKFSAIIGAALDNYYQKRRNMFYSNYTIQCRFLEDGTLSVFKGSALRGAFGHALKRAVCTVREKDCIACILHHQCLFAQFFMEQKTTQEGKTPSIPHPYIIEPPQNPKRTYSKGEEFDFSLILLGNLYEKLPFLVYAFELMGSRGIGRASNEELKSTPFEIIGIQAAHIQEQPQIYNPIKKQLSHIPSPALLEYSAPAFSKTDSSLQKMQELTVMLETPLRYKADNSFHSDLTFEDLFKLMARRITVAFKEFGEKEPEIDYKNLLQQAKNISIIESNIIWKDQKRYSARQKQALKIGGLEGRISFKGDFTEFIPLLNLAILLHLGKQTSFGLGKIQYELKDCTE